MILADRLAKREIIQLEQDIAERQQLLGIPSTDGMSCSVGAEADHNLNTCYHLIWSVYNNQMPRPRSNLETQGHEAVASQAPQGCY